MTTTAKISSKGCNGTGITEDLAQRLHDQLGRKVVAVVELVAESRSEKRNGDESVTLSILTIEPAPKSFAEDHLRNLQRSFYYERQLAEGGPQLRAEGDPIEPSVEDVVKANPGVLPHDYISSMLAVDDSEAGPVCDVCGKVEADVIHRMPTDNPFAVDEDEGDEDGDLDDEPDEDEEPDPYDEPHDYAAGPDDSCLCGAPYGNPIHLDVVEPDDEPEEVNA